MQAFLRLTTAALCLLATAACAPRITTHGTPMTRMEMADVTPGVDTRGSVRRQLGEPLSTSLVGGETWFYVSTVMEHETYQAARIIDRRVLAVSFDEAGLVVAANRYGLEDGALVALRSETTPTYGRELTIAQQIFGNLGRVGADQINR